jgi:hypothetical protein
MMQRGDRIRIISARKATPQERRQYEEGTNEKNDDELRPEYDLSRLKGGLRGKYFRQPAAGANLVLIEPDLSTVFPDTESVNRALRLLADVAATATEKPRTVPREPSKRLKRTA